jgi:hypothetical protein
VVRISEFRLEIKQDWDKQGWDKAISDRAASLPTVTHVGGGIDTALLRLEGWSKDLGAFENILSFL